MVAGVDSVGTSGAVFTEEKTQFREWVRKENLLMVDVSRLWLWSCLLLVLFRLGRGNLVHWEQLLVFLDHPVYCIYSQESENIESGH